MARIEVIDDDQAIRTTIKLLLEREGHEVVLAEDGRRGIEQFQEGQFDLLIVDIFMPGMDGLETIRSIHRMQPDIPIIVISGYGFRTALESVPDFLNMAMKFGAVSSLQKPFRPSQLLSAVTACLQDRGPRAAVQGVSGGEGGCRSSLRQSFLATAKVTSFERRLALWTVGIIAGLFVVAVPFAQDATAAGSRLRRQLSDLAGAQRSRHCGAADGSVSHLAVARTSGARGRLSVHRDSSRSCMH